MIISGIDKTNNNLEILNDNLDIKDLEIKNFTLDDDWSLISKAKNLENLTLRDSYIDYKKFYTAICSLKKLNKLTYNHYCYFNKTKKDKFPENLNLPPLKIFRLEFPDPEEPDFEINTYWQKSYKNKYNSITEVKDSHKVFNNLEQIEFVNYQTYKKKIINEDEKKDIKKVNSEVYWNMDFKTLSNFKSLKEIKIDNGETFDIVSAGLLNLQKKNLYNINFKFNGIKFSDFSKIVNENQNLSICSVKADIQEDIVFNEINKNIYESLNKILNNKLTTKIYEKNLYDTNYGWRKPWKIKKNSSLKLFNENIKTIIFPHAWEFSSSHSYSNGSKRKKIDLFLSLFENLKNLQNIVFDISYIDYDALEQNDIIFLKQFIHDLYEKFPNIKIFLKVKNIENILSDKKNVFRIYFIYLLNYLIDVNFFNNNLKFLGIDNQKLKEFYKDNLFNDVDEIIVVDDHFYNSSKRFKKIDLIFSSEIGSLIQHFPYLNKNYFNNPKKKFLFEDVYCDILRIADFENENFELNKKKLILLVKKNKIDVLKNLKFNKFFIYLGNNMHPVTHQMESDKKYKIDKINELNEKNSKKLYQAANQAVEDFINSKEFEVNKNTKKEFMQSTDTISNINNIEDFGIKRNQLENLTHCWFEGVNPWLGKYVILKDLNKLLPTKNLQYLRLSDCIGFDDFQIPNIDSLKYLRLDFYNNHHRKMIDPDFSFILKNFNNLPNLENLELRGLYNSFTNEISKSAGLTRYGYNRWGNINIDFSDIHKLVRLKKIFIDEIHGSNLKNINSLPAVEELTLNRVYNITKDMHPDDEIPTSITDRDFKFLNYSKNIKKFILNIGNIASKEDMWGDFLSSYYRGNGEFINYINHNIKELRLTINLDINNQLSLQDFINNICNRLLKLETLEISFGFAVNGISFNSEKNEFNKKIEQQIIDFKKIGKLKNLKSFKFWNWSSFMKYKTINFQEILKLKKIHTLAWHFETIDFQEFRKTRKMFKEEKYDDPSYYDYDYYADEDENYKKDWTRFNWIDTNYWEDDFVSLESVFIEREKEENKKKYKKPKEIIKKKKII